MNIFSPTPLIICIAVISLLLVGCYTKSDLSFKVHNYSSTDIQGEFHSFETGDTSHFQIIPGEIQPILTIPSSSIEHNWYYDYNIHILSITNVAGDTLDFDPNESSRWYMSGSSYVLTVSDFSF